jgi:hypothetical protein
MKLSDLITRLQRREAIAPGRDVKFLVMDMWGCSLPLGFGHIMAEPNDGATVIRLDELPYDEKVDLFPPLTEADIPEDE